MANQWGRNPYVTVTLTYNQAVILYRCTMSRNVRELGIWNGTDENSLRLARGKLADAVREADDA